MVKNSRNDSGSVLVVISIIVTVAVVGILGYVVWNRFINTPETSIDSSQTNTVDDSKPKSEIIVIENSDMNKYVNYEKNFEFLFPKKIYSASACQGSDKKYDTYGNTVPSEYHYGALDGPVDMTVLEDLDEYFIAPKNVIVQLQPSGSDEKGYIYKSCEKQPISIELIKESNTDTFGIKNMVIEQKSFIVKSAKTESDTVSIVRDIFGDKTGTVEWKQDLQNASRKNGTFLYTPNIERTGGFAYKLWYYPEEEKVVFFALGQSVFFQHPDRSEQFYNPVDSFKFNKKDF